MRWFKHYTDSLDDPFIQELMDEFSHLGYVIFFGIIEIIAKENKNEVTGTVSISPTYLGRKLRTTPRKVREVLEFCQEHGRLSVNFTPAKVRQLSGNTPTTVGQSSDNCQTNARQSSNNRQKKWEIHFPKIAEIKDNYTKDLQGSCKKLSKHKEKEKEEEKEKEKEKALKTSASSSAKADSPPEPGDSTPAITLPLNTGEEWPVSEDLVKEAEKLYPAVDVRQELRKMRGWLIGNSRNRKTRTGIRRFITSWLSREQDRTRGSPGPGGGGNSGGKTKTGGVYADGNQYDAVTERFDDNP